MNLVKLRTLIPGQVLNEIKKACLGLYFGWKFINAALEHMCASGWEFLVRLRRDNPLDSSEIAENQTLQLTGSLAGCRINVGSLLVGHSKRV